MTTKPVQPGDTVFELKSWNAVKKSVVKDVKSDGVLLRGNMWPTPFNSLYDSEEAAYTGMLARAQTEIDVAKRDLKTAESRLRALVKRRAAQVVANESEVKASNG